MANAKIYSDLAFNPLLNNEGDISQVYNQDAINQSLFNIMNTRRGTRVMDPEFGCDVHAYLFDMFDKETSDKIAEELYKSFVQYEPRIRIDSINRNLNFDTLQYTLEINYKIVNKNDQGKFTVVLQKL